MEAIKNSTLECLAANPRSLLSVEALGNHLTVSKVPCTQQQLLAALIELAKAGALTICEDEDGLWIGAAQQTFVAEDEGSGAIARVYIGGSSLH